MYASMVYKRWEIMKEKFTFFLLTIVIFFLFSYTSYIYVVLVRSQVLVTVVVKWIIWWGKFLASAEDYVWRCAKWLVIYVTENKMKRTSYFCFLRVVRCDGMTFKQAFKALARHNRRRISRRTLFESRQVSKDSQQAVVGREWHNVRLIKDCELRRRRDKRRI